MRCTSNTALNLSGPDVDPSLEPSSDELTQEGNTTDEVARQVSIVSGEHVAFIWRLRCSQSTWNGLADLPTSVVDPRTQI